MMWVAIILLATLFVAYSNGANDNFKGVATLFGSGTTNYRAALWWATATTFAGSVCAYFLAHGLIETFSGKGLVPASYIGDPAFLTSVILGAGLTVFIAARTGIPISTTHSLTGALIGAGLVAVGSHLGFATLGKSFFAPLLISPFLAVVFAFVLYPILHWGRQKLGITRETCLCIGENEASHIRSPLPTGIALAATAMPSMDVIMADKAVCEQKNLEIYGGRLFGIEAQNMLDGVHFLSAGAVSFARGLNDTPKIVALAATFGAIALDKIILIVAGLMAIGAIISARRVAETMSNRITTMNHGQGLTANLITAFMVLFASHLGVPVSTTHVSCGSLFGIGAANGKAHWKTIGGIFSAWVLTLPVAAVLSALFFWVLY
jgi:inorganic phosphate transporter, PiT family